MFTALYAVSSSGESLLLLMRILFCTQAYVLSAGPIATAKTIGTFTKTYLQCGRDP